MICPHCGVGVRFEPRHTGPVHIGGIAGEREAYDIAEGFCPQCSEFIVVLRRGRCYQHDLNDDNSRELYPDEEASTIVYPGPRNRRSVPSEVPDPYREDFLEACAVLGPSPKASAAISRRLLQHVFREELGIRQRTLDAEIAEFIARPGVPSHLSEAVDAVRNVGNLAAHPTKNANTGEVIPVEPGEADWLLDVLEALLDFVFVQPKRLAARKAALDAKLALAGKPPSR